MMTGRTDCKSFGGQAHVFLFGILAALNVAEATGT